MTHDPMCPVAPGRMFVGVLVCECDLIARVVERERERAAERVAALLWAQDGGGRAWVLLDEAVAAARGGDA